MIAFLDREPGFERVAGTLDGAALGAVNLAEVQSRAALLGSDPGTLATLLEATGVAVEPFTREDAAVAGGLRPVTVRHGLSLADRACLALAARLGRPVLTADSALARVETGITVELIR